MNHPEVRSTRMTTISEIQTAQGLCVHSHAHPAIFWLKQRNRSEKMKRTHLSLSPDSIWMIFSESKLKFRLKEQSWRYVRHDTKNLDNVVFSAHHDRAGRLRTSCRANWMVDMRQTGQCRSLQALSHIRLTFVLCFDFTGPIFPILMARVSLIVADF